MQSSRHFYRSNTLEIKAHISKKLGRERAEMYFTCIRKFLGSKLTKMELNTLLFATIGMENMPLHNMLIRSISRNSYLAANAPPAKRANTGQSPNSTISTGNLGEMVLTSPRKETSVNSRFRKVRDRPSPLGPYGKKVHGGIVQDISNSCDLQRPQEFVSVGSKALMEMGSVEDGEEVEQVRGSPCVQSRSPVTAPLGILTSTGGFPSKSLRKCLGAAFRRPHPGFSGTCCDCRELPDRGTLRTRLECNLEAEVLCVTDESVDLLNRGLDAYMKRLIKPCMELARARCNGETINVVNRKFHDSCGTWKNENLQMPNHSCSASLLDFQVAMKLNPQFLGEEWPVKLENICLREFK